MPAFRQVGEKQLPNEILCMVWSPKRDLIALANKAGEVLLHRLAHFQRVWSLAPNENTGKEVTSLAWRPDGKVLAFSLADTRRIVLCDVEKAEILHFFTLENVVTCMHWTEVTDQQSATSSFNSVDEEGSLFLPKLPALPKSTSAKIFSEEKSDEITKLLGDKRLNALVLGGDSGFIELYAYGMYKIATVTQVAGCCLDLCFSSDLKSLCVITKIQLSTETEPTITYFQLDTALLSNCLPEVTRMARKFTHISTLLQYQKLSLACMCEAWEDILMQMDLRLTTFVQEKNTKTSVQEEFMQLLMWGKASPELQSLLMNQLTVKGLKKLGQSIESSYSTIQKLVISHLQSGSEALLYHLSELKGMAMWKQKYQPLGLDVSAIEDAINAVGGFILKANELLQVIDNSMKNFKAFFRWLYAAMLRMSDDHVLPELNKMTHRDVAFVADFLSEHFKEAPELYDQKGQYFNVERVGQYLKDEDDDLVTPPETEGNPWFSFLQNSIHLKESPLLFPYHPKKSLHYVKRRVQEQIDICLQKPSEVIGKSVSQVVYMPLYRLYPSEGTVPRFALPSFWNDKSSNLQYIVFTMHTGMSSRIYIMRRPTDLSRSISNWLLAVEFGDFLCSSRNETKKESQFHFLDVGFYDDEMLTVLLKEQVGGEEKGRILAQLPLSSIYMSEQTEEEFRLDVGKRLGEQVNQIPVQTVTLENQCRTLENMKAQYIAANGIRKVSCVLSSNLRHVRVFEMDVEDDGEVDEEEEEPDSQDISGLKEDMEETLDTLVGPENSGAAAVENPALPEDDASSLESVPGNWT
ncbi:anaphase-promoting complex subunit 4 isoform X2 [Callorhinchus milii]|uniref:anaphase-promoting complex subunit 4 isoform X2 n=1 Tax=Callorhinchus milii TaxID=7868 RepID=UPI001C3FF254|nr:anaphase-promoting complex subunit 4 isoform X2 [Callorhinchus milii]